MYALPVCSCTSPFLSYLLVSFPQRTCTTPAFMSKQTKSPGIENTQATKAKAHASASEEKRRRDDDQTEPKQIEQTVRFQPNNRKHPMRQVFETPLMSGVLWKPRVLLVNKQADGLKAYHDWEMEWKPDTVTACPDFSALWFTVRRSPWHVEVEDRGGHS